MLGGLLVGALRARRRVPEGDIGVMAGLIAAFGVFLFARGGRLDVGVHRGRGDGGHRGGGRHRRAVESGHAAAPAGLAASRSWRWRSSPACSSSRASSPPRPSARASASSATRNTADGARQRQRRDPDRALGGQPVRPARAGRGVGSDQLQAARLDLLRAQKREPTNWRQPLLLCTRRRGARRRQGRPRRLRTGEAASPQGRLRKSAVSVIARQLDDGPDR